MLIGLAVHGWRIEANLEAAIVHTTESGRLCAGLNVDEQLQVIALPAPRCWILFGFCDQLGLVAQNQTG